MSDFNLESYIEHSRKVDVSDMDFSEAARYPLSPEEIRCLTYMMDVEAHTIVYLKGILSTCAVRDPRTTAFLSCWAYEEFFHGHTLRRFLEAAGAAFSPMRMAEIQREGFLARLDREHRLVADLPDFATLSRRVSHLGRDL